MALVVQKYGGTSVADIDRIRRVAARVARAKDAGHDVIVVVSAMAGETDRLAALAHTMTSEPDQREYDVLVSTGEQVSIALLAMALHSLGYGAKSFLAHQVKIVTDRAYSRARIVKIESDRLEREVEGGTICVIAGFQGMDEDGNVTTLGRGGSDTTAVALAAALHADLCEIYTDVDGVYTADPRVVPDARKLPRVSYEEMLEMASAGARVLQIRSVEFAKNYGVPLHVRSSFAEDEGTIVMQEDQAMEKVVVSGVTYNLDEAKITVVRVPDRPGIAAQIFDPVGREGIVVDMIIQNASAEGYTDLTFTVPKADARRALLLVQAVADRIGAEKVTADEEIAKVSIVGVGMRSHAGVASRMFWSLARAGINILMISTSEIKISCVVKTAQAETAVRVLHETFALGADQAVAE